MPLTCQCDDDDFGSGPWYWMPSTPDYIRAPVLRRRKRCKSCGKFINPGDDCTNHPRFTYPRTEVEAKILGTNGCEDWYAEIPLAPTTLCERCSDIFFSLQERGFCVYPCEDMLLLLSDYQSDYADSNT